MPDTQPRVASVAKNSIAHNPSRADDSARPPPRSQPVMLCKRSPEAGINAPANSIAAEIAHSIHTSTLNVSSTRCNCAGAPSIYAHAVEVAHVAHPSAIILGASTLNAGIILRGTGHSPVLGWS